MRVEEQYTDVLQNIEFGIVCTYRRHPGMVDHEVMRTLEAVMDGYKAEKIGRPPRDFGLSETEKDLLGAVRDMCEWRLGRPSPLASATKGQPPLTSITIDEILLCLKRLVKSVNTWNREMGRQGYLNFIVQYVH